MSIGLVISDVDGTLLGPDHRLDDSAREAIRLSRERGAEFTLATGRVFSSARAVALDAGITAPIIAGGGSVIGYPDGGIIRRLCLERDVALEILRYTGTEGRATADSGGARRGVVFRYAFVSDRIYTDTPGPHATMYSSALGVPVQVVDDLKDVVNDETSHVVLRLDPSEAADCVGQFAGAFRGAARVIRSLPHLVEFMHPEASKGRALEELCRFLGIPASGVVAIGDGESDTDMLAVAGVGVLVANAPPDVRLRCRHVTREPYCRGVLEAVRMFLPDPGRCGSRQVGSCAVKK